MGTKKEIRRRRLELKTYRVAVGPDVITSGPMWKPLRD
jgi:hypothetical protein